MDYYVKSVIPIIESNYENFTALEKKNVDFEAIENLFINMRNHLKRKIKNSRDIQEPC